MSEIHGTAHGADALTDLTRRLLEDDEVAYAYLMESWLTAAAGKLREARREAGLTQEEVAERLGTKHYGNYYGLDSGLAQGREIHLRRER